MSDFVIGDISGYKENFDELIKNKPWISRIVALGDIIDRGPDSRGMIEFFKNNKEHVCLMGNHEHMFIKCYEEVMEGKKSPYMLIFWVYVNGGKETLESYGVKVPDIGRTRKELVNMFPNERKVLSESPEIKELKSQFSLIPKEDIEFLKTLPMFIETATAFYSHASVKNWREPKLFDYKVIDKNELVLDISCLWNRSLPDKARADGKFYVYGHQNKPKVLVHSNKYPIGKYVEDLDLTLPSDAWGACIDTVKAGYLTGLKMDDLAVHYSFLKDKNETN